MGTDAPVIWRPTPKQAEFLAASEDEVLYRGAAGSGKSDAWSSCSMDFEISDRTRRWGRGRMDRDRGPPCGQ